MKGIFYCLMTQTKNKKKTNKKTKKCLLLRFSLLSQLPSSRPASTLLSQHQEDYLLATRNSGFNPYALASSGLDHSSLHPSMYSHPYASYRSVLPKLAFL
jgi:hypothetical protein